MHRFFIPRPYADEMEIDGIDARHIYTVLKMKPGLTRATFTQF